jgi:hypothetical protein|tara:strand:+ start:98 stop:1447 length:1350 start_codon:yes stop_codon:yes gene_type:complete
MNNKIFSKILVITLVCISFFLGYILRENATGGGPEFYKLSWPIIQSFRKDFFFTINNYATFGDGTIPFSHIINAYLNPFSDIETNFQFSVTVMSFIIFCIFVLIFKRVFSDIKLIDLLLTSSVILLLPFYRSSAFWGKNENYGWLFFILALYFFFEIKKNISKNPNNKDILNVIFFCLTSACALYARQALVFLPISYLLYLFFYKTNKKIIIISIISFSIFAIPGLLLILIWGDIYDTKYMPSDAFYGHWIHPKYILINIPIILSFFGFYLLPIITIEFLNSDFKNFYNKYYKSFVFALVILIILTYSTNYIDYLGNYIQGGGAILKINYLILRNNFLLLLIFSSLGFSLLIRFFKEDRMNNLIFILPIFVIYGCRNPMFQYQEYYEPLILLIFFFALKTNLQQIFFKNISLSNVVFLSYFTIYLIGSIYFKHFAFDSYEKWKIFLGVQ